jgi:GR25 family glycosyltransferase involved in LPS biosynthesis
MHTRGQRAIVMRVKAYIVHLERSTSRHRQVRELAAALPLPTAILPAVDGRQLDEGTRRRFVRRRIHSPRYPFKLLDTEIGCFLSYRRAWETLLADGCDAGLIAEDDVAAASPRFIDVIEHAIAAIQPDDYIRFPLHERGEGTVPATSTAIIEPRLPGLGMQMQLVGREAARRLLAASEVFDRPVDSFVQMQWLHGARVLSARPVIIREVDFALGGSVVQLKNGGLVHKAVHEFRRPILRMAVRVANERWRRRSAA